MCMPSPPPYKDHQHPLQEEPGEEPDDEDSQEEEEKKQPLAVLPYICKGVNDYEWIRRAY